MMMVLARSKPFIEWCASAEPAPSPRMQVHAISKLFIGLLPLADIVRPFSAGHVFVQIGQAGCFGDIRVVHPSEALGPFPLAHPAFRIRSRIFDLEIGSLVDQADALDHTE